MPRTLPMANGNLHVSFDYRYRVRDIYHYHLGLNNQTGGVPWRLGVWVDGAMSWVQTDDWQRGLCYALAKIQPGRNARRELASLDG